MVALVSVSRPQRCCDLVDADVSGGRALACQFNSSKSMCRARWSSRQQLSVGLELFKWMGDAVIVDSLRSVHHRS